MKKKQKMHLDNLPASMFLGEFQNTGTGDCGQKKENGDVLEVLETKKIRMIGFWAFPVTKYFETRPIRLV